MALRGVLHLFLLLLLLLLMPLVEVVVGVVHPLLALLALWVMERRPGEHAAKPELDDRLERMASA
jgi:hypothetical protein